MARFDGTVVKRGNREVVLPANSSTVIGQLDFEQEMDENPEHMTYRKDSYENRGKFYLSYKLVQGERVLSSNVSFFTPQKYLQLPEPRLKYEFKKRDNRLWVTVLSEQFAAYVALGLTNSYASFSDNYFHLLPGETKEIEVIEAEVLDREVRRQLFVHSLTDSYSK
ncbi:glycoside hydrolase family 2 protein [Candidatus Neomarinimicrobiota bacterium]